MGTPWVEEMAFIFLLAVVLFGPNELPEVGRKIGKAIAGFRRSRL